MALTRRCTGWQVEKPVGAWVWRGLGQHDVPVGISWSCARNTPGESDFLHGPGEADFLQGHLGGIEFLSTVNIGSVAPLQSGH